jgi:hypothetical protein
MGLLQLEERFTVGMTLVHGMHLGAIWAGAFFKVPQKIRIWGILIKIPLIHTYFGGILIKVPLITKILGHFEEVPQKLATFWSLLKKCPKRLLPFGAL